MTATNHALTEQQAEIVVNRLVDKFLDDSKAKSQDGSPCYASVTGRLRVVIESLLTGTGTSPTLDAIIEQAGFKTD